MLKEEIENSPFQTCLKKKLALELWGATDRIDN